MGVGLRMNEVEKITLEVAWDGAGAWAGDEAIGAAACATARVPAGTEIEATPEVVTLYS